MYVVHLYIYKPDIAIFVLTFAYISRISGDLLNSVYTKLLNCI